MAISLTSRRRVGAIDLRLPPFGFGSAHLGGMYQPVPADLAHATLDAAWQAGVRYYDTAPFYGRGLSEHRVGDYLLDKPRDEFVLTTKIGRYFRRPADPEDLRPRALGRRAQLWRSSGTIPMTASCAPTSRACSGSGSTPSTDCSSTIPSRRRMAMSMPAA